MIARIFSESKSFRGVCRYICKDLTRAEVLDQEGVRGHDYRMMARDFEVTHDLRPERSKKMVFHGILDFHPNEDMNNAKMVEIARKYLEAIGMTNTPYAIVKHTDRRHLHVHLVASRIDYSGKYHKGYLEWVKSKDIVQGLCQEYQLMPAEGKNLRQTNMEALNASETRLYKIYRCIKENLPYCQKLEDLETRLLEYGIDVQYRYDEQTGKRRGISFRYEKEAFKGSRVDRAYSLGRLEHTLALRQELTVWEQQKLALGKEQELSLRKEGELTRQQKLALAKEETLFEELKQQQKIKLVNDERLTPKRGYRLRIS